MGKQVTAHGHAGADSGFGRKVLGGQGKREAHDTQEDEERPHLPEIGAVVPGNPHIDHLRHHQGDKELKGGLQHLEERSHDRDEGVGL